MIPAATPSPAPATFAATRTASPTGSGPLGGVFVGGRGAVRRDAVPPLRDAVPAGVRPPWGPLAEPPAFPAAARGFEPAGRAPEPPVRDPDARAFETAARGFEPPARELAPPPEAAPGFAAACRFSLRRPGRERGRLPITPWSSLTD